MDFEQVSDFSFENIEIGAEYIRSYEITDAVYRALTDVFQDKSPVHVDEQYAASSGFSGRVMHGAILQGFLSHFVGMHFPGKKSLILSVNINYHRPSYLGDEILLAARVRQTVETGRVVVLEVKFTNVAAQTLAASGKVQVALRNE